MGDPTARNPVALVLDMPPVADLLYRAALAMSFNVNSDMLMRDTESFALKIGRTLYNHSYGLALLVTGRKEGSFAMEVGLDFDKAERDAAGFFELFCERFVNCASAGGGPLALYLAEKATQTDYALRSLAYKFSQSESVNREVIQSLNTGIDRAHRIKVVSEVAMTVIGAFVPVSWVVNTAIGVGYTLTAEIAKSLAEADHADLVAFRHGVDGATSTASLQANGAATLGNVAQDVTGGRAARAAYLLAKARLANQQAVTKYSTRIATYAGQGAADPANLTRAQGKLVDKGWREIVKTSEEVATGEGRHLAERGGVAAARGASILVGLFFMKDEIVKAWKGYTASEEEQRRHR